MISHISRAICVVAVLALTACNPKPAPKPAKKPARAQTAPATELNALYEKNTIQVTLDEFDQIRPGMTEEQVIAVIGADPTSRKSRFNPPDENGYVRPSATIILRWDNPDDSWCELEMRDKKVDVKRHQDLRSAASYAHSNYNLPLPATPKDTR